MSYLQRPLSQEYIQKNKLPYEKIIILFLTLMICWIQSMGLSNSTELISNRSTTKSTQHMRTLKKWLWGIDMAFLNSCSCHSN
jgi:hypothetical protein